MASGVYRILHHPTGRVYVGSAVSLNSRINQHKASLNRGDHDNQRLQRAWNKYGWHTFLFDTLELVEDKSLLITTEQRWLDKLRAAEKPNFNICRFAGSTLGVKPSAETRAKMSVSKKGRRTPLDVVAKIAAANRGKKRSAETIAKISAALKGRKMHPNTRAAIRAAVLGSHLSDETKLKMSLAKKGREFTVEHKAALSAARRRNQS